jgi:DNA-binding transcriptional ArsR family regulator
VALADPTRREIVELLRKRRSANVRDIASRFRQVSRPAISQHLRVLRECGLVVSEGKGRENLYVLDPRPLLRARDGWLASFGNEHVERLKALRRRVEREPSGSR